MKIFKCLSILVVFLNARGICGAPEEKLNLLPSDCGTSEINYENAIVTNVPHPADFPWMAILRFNTSRGTQDSCIGSLINKRYVLTAGHCLKNTGSQQLQKIILGEFDKSHSIDCTNEESERNCFEPIEEFDVESVTVHPEHNQRSHRNDIGLIRLDRDVTMKDNIQAICLPVTSALGDKQYENYVVSSWLSPYSNIGTNSNALHKANVRHMNSTTCTQKFAKLSPYIELSEQHQICTQSSNVICRGSAGAPLGNTALVGGKARFVQFGIVSFGSRTCGDPGVPEAYTRVASYMDWILSTIEP